MTIEKSTMLVYFIVLPYILATPTTFRTVIMEEDLSDTIKMDNMSYTYQN